MLLHNGKKPLSTIIQLRKATFLKCGPLIFKIFWKRSVYYKIHLFFKKSQFQIYHKYKMSFISSSGTMGITAPTVFHSLLN